MFWYKQPAVRENNCKSCKKEAADILPNVTSAGKSYTQSTYFNVNTISLLQHQRADSAHISQHSFNGLQSSKESSLGKTVFRTQLMATCLLLCILDGFALSTQFSRSGD